MCAILCVVAYFLSFNLLYMYTVFVNELANKPKIKKKKKKKRKMYGGREERENKTTTNTF